MCVIVIFLLGLGAVFGTNSPYSTSSVPASSDLSARYSTNPGSPENLGNGLPLKEWYPSGSDDYYYETYSTFPGDYHVVTAYSYDPTLSGRQIELRPRTPNNPSGGINGFATWQVFRPSSSGAIDPEVETIGGSGGAVVEAESALDIVVGEVYESYEFFETATEKFELCEVNVTAGTTYTVFLTPNQNYGHFGVFWIDVVHMPVDGGQWPDDWHFRYSIDVITRNIYLTFTPQYTDTYAILIMKYEPQSDELHKITLIVYEGIYFETWLIIVLSLVGVVACIAICRGLYKRYAAKRRQSTAVKRPRSVNTESQSQGQTIELVPRTSPIEPAHENVRTIETTARSLQAESPQLGAGVVKEGKFRCNMCNDTGICTACNGQGLIHGDRTCEMCDGSGACFCGASRGL